jgi:hypothetical protein
MGSGEGPALPIGPLPQKGLLDGLLDWLNLVSARLEDPMFRKVDVSFCWFGGRSLNYLPICRDWDWNR